MCINMLTKCLMFETIVSQINLRHIMGKRGLSKDYKLMREKFVLEYDGNVSDTCNKIGITRATAYRYLKDPDIIAKIRAKGDKEIVDIQVTVLNKAGRLQKLTQIILDEDERTSDRLKALELLGKACGDFIELRHEVGGSLPGADEIADRLERAWARKRIAERVPDAEYTVEPTVEPTIISSDNSGEIDK